MNFENNFFFLEKRKRLWFDVEKYEIRFLPICPLAPRIAILFMTN
jgi:hypothetical protein